LFPGYAIDDIGNTCLLEKAFGLVTAASTPAKYHNLLFAMKLINPVVYFL
jgi:hypothetical protein